MIEAETGREKNDTLEKDRSMVNFDAEPTYELINNKFRCEKSLIARTTALDLINEENSFLKLCPTHGDLKVL